MMIMVCWFPSLVWVGDTRGGTIRRSSTLSQQLAVTPLFSSRRERRPEGADIPHKGQPELRVTGLFRESSPPALLTAIAMGCNALSPSRDTHISRSFVTIKSVAGGPVLPCEACGPVLADCTTSSSRWVKRTGVVEIGGGLVTGGDVAGPARNTSPATY